MRSPGYGFALRVGILMLLGILAFGSAAAATNSGNTQTYTEQSQAVYCLESRDRVTHTNGVTNFLWVSTTPRPAGECATSNLLGWTRQGGIILQGTVWPNPVQWCLVFAAGPWTPNDVFVTSVVSEFGQAQNGVPMPCGDKFYSVASNHDGQTFGGYERINQASPWLWLHQNFI